MKNISKKAAPVIQLRTNVILSLFGLLLSCSISANAEDALRLRIDGNGGIFELSGNKVGELIDRREKRPKLTVDARGNILDGQRRVVGKIDTNESGPPTASQMPSDEVSVKVDKKGNIFDNAGNIIGKLRDESEKGRELSVDGSGNIIDGKRRVVGRITINGVPTTPVAAAPSPVAPPVQRPSIAQQRTVARTPAPAPAPPKVAPPARPTPIYDLARASAKPSKVVSNAVAIEQPVPMGGAHAVSGISPDQALALSRRDPNVVIVSELAPYVSFPDGRRKRVIMVDDITYRRHELDSRIDERIAEGKLTEADARQLRNELASSKPMEDQFRSGDGLDFKESKKMYSAFDRIASRIDSISKKRRVAHR